MIVWGLFIYLSCTSFAESWLIRLLVLPSLRLRAGWWGKTAKIMTNFGVFRRSYSKWIDIDILSFDFKWLTLNWVVMTLFFAFNCAFWFLNWIVGTLSSLFGLRKLDWIVLRFFFRHFRRIKYWRLMIRWLLFDSLGIMILFFFFFRNITSLLRRKNSRLFLENSYILLLS